VIREVKDLDKTGKSNSLYPHKPNEPARLLLHHFYSQQISPSRPLALYSFCRESPHSIATISTLRFHYQSLIIINYPTQPKTAPATCAMYRKALVAEIDCKAGNDDTVMAGPQLADGRIYVDQRRQALPTKCTTASRIKMCQERHSLYWSPDQTNSRGSIARSRLLHDTTKSPLECGE
jgi:hypothetical protein